MWRSSLENQPEYVRQIGMVSIENANLEMAMAELFGRSLMISQRIARAIYFAPKAATARLDVFDDAIKTAMAPTARHDEVSELGRQKADALAKVRKLAKRARVIVYKRHEVIHDAWGVSDETGAVTRSPLPVGPNDEGRPSPPSELKDLIRNTRILIGEIRTLAEEFRLQPPLMVDLRLPSPDKDPQQIPAEPRADSQGQPLPQ
jgi:hypothetical protein